MRTSDSGSGRRRVDPLTRIANRRHFDKFFEQEWQRAVRSAESLSQLVPHVDHFKLYNDALGHAAGDTAARYGSEEFVVLFGETGAEAARVLAESIRAAIRLSVGLVRACCRFAPQLPCRRAGS